jgi:hypothetical protein
MESGRPLGPGPSGGCPSAASLAIYPSIITVHATATQYQYPLAASTARVIREREASIPPSALWRGRSKRFAFVAESSPTPLEPEGVPTNKCVDRSV